MHIRTMVMGGEEACRTANASGKHADDVDDNAEEKEEEDDDDNDESVRVGGAVGGVIRKSPSGNIGKAGAI
jgi:hypothetical protein